MDSPLSRMKLRLLTAFCLAFVFAAVIAAGVQHAQEKNPLTAPDAAAAPTIAADADTQDEDSDQAPIVWPADAGSPEQVMYAQPQRMRRRSTNSRHAQPARSTST